MAVNLRPRLLGGSGIISFGSGSFLKVKTEGIKNCLKYLKSECLWFSFFYNHFLFKPLVGSWFGSYKIIREQDRSQCETHFFGTNGICLLILSSLTTYHRIGGFYHPDEFGIRVSTTFRFNIGTKRFVQFVPLLSKRKLTRNTFGIFVAANKSNYNYWTLFLANVI